MKTNISPGQQILFTLSFQPGTATPIDIMSFLKRGTSQEGCRTSVLEADSHDEIFVNHTSFMDGESRKVKLTTCTSADESNGDIHIIGSETVDEFPKVSERMKGEIIVPAQSTWEAVSRFALELMVFLVVHGDGWEDSKGNIHWIKPVKAA